MYLKCMCVYIKLYLTFSNISIFDFLMKIYLIGKQRVKNSEKRVIR